MDKMNELRRWHSSKANILQIKIRDSFKVIEELEKKKRDLMNNLKLKTEQAKDKVMLAERVQLKVAKALKKQKSPTIIENQIMPNTLSVGDLEMSPTYQDGPNFIVKDDDLFGEPKDQQLPKYFNGLNDDCIEKKTFYQDDQSNIAEARSLLKALDPADIDQALVPKSKLTTMPILDGLSTYIPSAKHSDEN